MTNQKIIPAANPAGSLAFTPVPRKTNRHDGWTVERQRGFIDALADYGSVNHAARAVGMTPEGAYYLRRAPGAESFCAAWEAALCKGVCRLVDVTMERALNGVPVPVFHKGEQVGERRVYNDRLAMFHMRHRLPEQYGALVPPARGTKSAETVARERGWSVEEARAWIAGGGEPAEDESARRKLLAKLDKMARNLRLADHEAYKDDPAKIAAWELLNGRPFSSILDEVAWWDAHAEREREEEVGAVDDGGRIVD